MKIRYHPANFYIDQIRDKEFFTFPKILHGFWEKLVGLDMESVSRHRQSYYISPEYQTDHRLRSIGYNPHLDTYYGELFDLLKGPQPPGNFYLGVSHQGFPHDDALVQPLDKIQEVMVSLVGNNDNLHSGLVWKNAVYNGMISRFLETIAAYRVVVVGMDHLSDLRNAWNLPEFHHYIVYPPVAARLDQTIKELHRYMHLNRDRPTVYLIQVGGSAGAFMLYNLHNRVDNCWLIDMGRSLDAWLNVGKDQLWVQKMPGITKRILGIL